MKILILLSLLAIATGCGNKISKDELTKALNENPQVLADVIEKNPELLIGAIQNAAKKAQGQMAQKQQQSEAQAQEEYFKNPLVPNIRSDEMFMGNKSAPITIVEYSDFECPFCSRGYSTLKAVQQKYGDKVRVVYKHLPLDFHPQALISAKYYEAVRLQDEKKASKFHDEIFENQAKLKEGPAFLDAIAKKLGVNMAKLKKDIESPAVLARIEEDKQEAQKFGIQGTPGFVINGVPLKGAYPVESFDQIIAKLKI